MPTVKIKSRKPGDITLRKERNILTFPFPKTRAQILFNITIRREYENLRSLLLDKPGNGTMPGMVRPDKGDVDKSVPGRTCHPFVR